MTKLRHLHLPGLTRYATAQTLQESLARRLLDHKASVSRTSSNGRHDESRDIQNNATPPSPTIITAQFHPVYTLGRREKLATQTQDYEAFLRMSGKVDVYEATRGGQTTYHGPGQLVAYPILDLTAHNLTPRTYTCLLEKSMIATCAKFGVEAFRTEHTGVWVSEERKIGALGVHLRRNVASHGVGLNVGTDLAFFDRIVACGLADKRATSLERELREGERWNEYVDRLTVEEAGDVFVGEMARALKGVDGIVREEYIPEE